MPTSRIVKPPVNRAVVWKTALSIVAVGLFGAALTVAAFITSGEPSPSGSGIALSGQPATVAFGGFLLALLAAVALIPGIIIARETSRKPVNPPPPRRTAATPAAGGSAADQRRAAALQGGNTSGLSTRRNTLSSLIRVLVATGLFLAAVATVTVLVPEGSSLDFLKPALWVGTFIPLTAWFYLRHFRDPKAQLGYYSNFYNDQPADTHTWGAAAITERKANETVRYITNPAAEDTRTGVDRITSSNFTTTQLFNSLSNTPTSPTQPRTSPWVDAMWRRHGAALLGREIMMGRLAATHNSNLEPYVPANSPDRPPPAPTVLIDGGRFAHYFQQRNAFTLPDDEYPIDVTDLIMLSNTTQKTNNRSVGYKNYVPNIQTFTYLETWFPADHWLTVYPRTRTLLNRWGSMGHKIDASARQFNRLYDVQTDSPQWARLVLNPAVMKTLIDLNPIRLTVDAGRLTLHSHHNWFPTDTIPHLAEQVRDIAQSAKAAER